MSDDNMEADESLVSRKAKSLDALIGGSFPASLSKLSSSSRTIPANKDFHFFNNFDEFKRPIDEIAGNSQSILETIGGATQVWGKPMGFSGDIDGDDAYEWLVNVNDEIFERFDVTMDEFERIRKKEEEIGRPLGPGGESEENGFQMVYGKKKKAAFKDIAGLGRNTTGGFATGVKVAERDTNVSGAGKSRVPFHIRTIKKPQEEYNILVNNANQPFEHVWLERSENDQRFVHPLEKLSVMDFVDKNIGDVEPIMPPSLEDVPFKLVEDVKDLKNLAAKLRSAQEFAVDLEHNQYRSFQGLTCLMQISTRTEDYIVDTFKLRIHIGPYLREVFKDPRKKKVMHGADRDILWLQRDFGIYVCNLFDTGQASRVLKLERNSLEFLLQHFCGVTANKEYQNADWRIRPLPNEMIRYAREDTHYLLYIYDVMKIKLQSMQREDEQQSDSPLVEVYKRSYDICMQLYEKELLTENSYLHIYGLQGAGFNAVQLAIVSGLCEWRDVIARAEDESTGYVLPNKILLEIAKEMPVTTGKLRRLLKSKHPYIERNIGSVVSVIRHSMQNAAAFEAAAQFLKEVLVKNTEVTNGSSAVVSEGLVETEDPSPRAEDVVSPNSKEKSLHIENHNENLSAVSVNRNEGKGLFPLAKVSSAVQVSKKPSSGFGALLGASASKRKLETDNKRKEEIKVEQIRSSVNLPFHSSSAVPTSVSKADNVVLLEDDSDEEPAAAEIAFTPTRGAEMQSEMKPEGSGSKQNDAILLDSGSEEEPSIGGGSESGNAAKEEKSASEVDEEDEPMSLSELSDNFQKCFKAMKQSKKSENADKQEKEDGFMSLKPGFFNIKPFDYEAAREEVKFGEEGRGQGEEKRKKTGDSAGKKKGLGGGQGTKKSDEGGEFAPGKRRQAFPASGNRSATFL